MSWFSSWAHPGRAYDKGQKELDKYYKESQDYLNPYNQNGQEQYGNLSEYIKNFMDPGALRDKWASNYKESESAQQAEKMAQEHGLNSASSMGLLGSNTALNAIQSGTANIANEDKESYLSDLMQKYLAGAGLASGIYGQGGDAARQLSQNAQQMGQNSAEMAYNKQQSGGNLFGGLLNMGATVAGGALGGPMGAALAKRWNLSGGS